MQRPKGKLIAIGGAEDKGTNLERGEIHRNNLNFFELAILRRFVQEAGGNEARIEVITTASTIPVEVGNNYLNAFGKIGCINIGEMHIRNRFDASNAEFLERLQACDAVMFSGGNQMRLTATFGGTQFLKILLERYENEALCDCRYQRRRNGYEQYDDLRRGSLKGSPERRSKNCNRTGFY